MYDSAVAQRRRVAWGRVLPIIIIIIITITIVVVCAAWGRRLDLVVPVAQRSVDERREIDIGPVCDTRAPGGFGVRVVHHW